MTKQNRRRFTAAFKTKVVLDALRERQSIEALAKGYELHPNQITTWKKKFLSKASVVFDSKEGGSNSGEPNTEKLYAQIGQLKVEHDFLKKKLF